MGVGFVIRLSDGCFYVLFDGMIWFMFLIKYMLGIVLVDGFEIIIYVGIGMVNFCGVGFMIYY